MNRSTSNSAGGHQITLEGKHLQEGWDFAKADTSYLTHGLHDYPARMVPQIAHRLIETYTREGDKILDPFCGSGTTLVEAALLNRKAIGTDINPFAILLAKVKTTPIDFEAANFSIYDYLSGLQKEYRELREKRLLPNPPVDVYANLLHWFKEDVAKDLEILYKKISAVENPDIRDLLKIVFSATIFKCSNIDLRSSRFIRILPEDKLKKFKPDVISYFQKRAIDSFGRVASFSNEVKRPEIKVLNGDARKLEFANNTFDAIISSPPYGEEKNTVSYARWSKLSIAWLRLNHGQVKDAERLSLGFVVTKEASAKLEEFPSPTVKALLAPLLISDPNRVKDSLPFFEEYLVTLREMYRVLKPGAHCCLVIGDRSIRRKPLDMEKVTVELGEEAGFQHQASYFRKIPMKLIPWTTPTGQTISRESIVILRKL